MALLPRFFSFSLPSFLFPNPSIYSICTRMTHVQSLTKQERKWNDPRSKKKEWKTNSMRFELKKKEPNNQKETRMSTHNDDFLVLFWLGKWSSARFFLNAFDWNRVSVARFDMNRVGMNRFVSNAVLCSPVLMHTQWSNGWGSKRWFSSTDRENSPHTMWQIGWQIVKKLWSIVVRAVREEPLFYLKVFGGIVVAYLVISYVLSLIFYIFWNLALYIAIGYGAYWLYTRHKFRFRKYGYICFF